MLSRMKESYSGLVAKRRLVFRSEPVRKTRKSGARKSDWISVLRLCSNKDGV